MFFQFDLDFFRIVSKTQQSSGKTSGIGQSQWRLDIQTLYFSFEGLGKRGPILCIQDLDDLIPGDAGALQIHFKPRPSPVNPVLYEVAGEAPIVQILRIGQSIDDFIDRGSRFGPETFSQLVANLLDRVVAAGQEFQRVRKKRIALLRHW